jgi:hypothetical protein
MKKLILIKKVGLKVLDYFNSVFTDGAAEFVKGMFAGGGVGAITESWSGFFVGVFVGALVGLFIGSSLGNFFDKILESLHLLFNVRKVHFTVAFDGVPPEIGKNIRPHYALVRYGRGDVVKVSAISKQDRLATEVRNSEYKLNKVYDSSHQRLVLMCAIKRHVTYGVQFKLYFTGVDYGKLQDALAENEAVKEVRLDPDDPKRIQVLLRDKTEVTDRKSEKKYRIKEVKSETGERNNYIYPK